MAFQAEHAPLGVRGNLNDGVLIMNTRRLFLKRFAAGGSVALFGGLSACGGGEGVEGATPAKPVNPPVTPEQPVRLSRTRL